MSACSNEKVLKSRMKTCLRILNKYSWLLNSYVLDFFAENHWDKLPDSWKNHLKLIPVEEFFNLMNLTVTPQNIWPLSILCLRTLIKNLQLSREFKSNDIHFIESNKISTIHVPELANIKSTCFDHPKLRNYFLKHVKPKKRYEIFKMASTSAKVARELGITFVVDIGSGLGHLSRIMAYGFNLTVCSIETQSQFIKQAQILDLEFEKISKKYLKEEESEELKRRRPVYLNLTITPDLKSQDFVKMIKETFSSENQDFKFGIIGLHPCGNLAIVLLQHFSESPEAKFISLVGCCYHKLSSKSDSHETVGFPLTNINDFDTSFLSYEAKALACHAVESYRERLISKDYDHLKVHCYRASLEYIISKYWPHLRKSGLANVKYGPGLTFSEYCKSALKKSDTLLPEEDLSSSETLGNLCSWQEVVKFYSLRLMLAPLIETVILLDRQIFLLEQGFECTIRPAFDPAISPRNQLLVSYKKDNDPKHIKYGPKQTKKLKFSSNEVAGSKFRS